MPRYSRFGDLDSRIANDGDSTFFRLNNRLHPDQLKPGEVTESINGRMDLDGSWQVRKGVDTFGSSLTANSESITLLASPTWKLYDATPINISAASRTTTTVTVDCGSAHGFTSNTLVYISGLTGTVDPNGNRLITVTDSDSFTFTIAGAAGSETYGGTGTAKGAALLGTAAAIYGSCLFSSPAAAGGNYIIIVTNQDAKAVSLDTAATTTITFPASTTISSQVDVVQAFDKVIIFRNGLQALEWNGVLTGSPAFTLVAGGLYTAPTYLNSASNTVAADGVVTVTEASHGMAVGDFVYVVDRGASELIEASGDYERYYTVATVPTTGAFTVNAQIPDVSTTVVWTKRISAGKGFIHMPGPAWGVYHQRRLWVPYAYEPASGPSYTYRNVRDELLASDILDSDTYDKIEAQFRVTAGIADYLVAVHPFSEDNLLVFNRHSIHLIKGISGSLLDTSTQMITNELGCVARKSIAPVGNQILFLSDNGVYAAAFGDLYNLRGAGIPLSEPIQSTINRINRDYAQNAVATYLGNRYYLAVPLDDSTTNNAILVYNFLNQGWESIDDIVGGALDIDNLIVGDSGGISSIYAIGSAGAIHKLDAREDGNDRVALYPGIDPATYYINSEITTRQYAFGVIDRKKFSSFELHIDSSSSEASNGSIAVEVENPDSSETLTTVSDLLGGVLGVAEDASLRGRIGNKRGYGAKLTFTPSAGRPKVRAVSMQAALTNPAISQAT